MTSDMSSSIGAVESGFSRRNFVHAAAWAMPVVATAVAVPLAAATGGGHGTDRSDYEGGAPQLRGRYIEGASHVGDIWADPADLILIGRVGATSGDASVIVNVPVGYTPGRRYEPATPLVEGDVIDGWVVAEVVTLASGRMRVTFVHPPLVIEEGQSEASATFPGIYLTLNEGATGAPVPGTSDTAARVRLGVANAGGTEFPLGESFFPALLEEG